MVQVVLLGEVLESSLLILDLFILSIYVLDHRGHVSDGIRVEAYTCYHYEYANPLFTSGTDGNVSIPYCCKSLKDEIERHQIFVRS
jgi:hypothetical protein